MKTYGLISILSLLAPGCAGGSDPGEAGTEIGSGSETEEPTSPVTTESSTSSPSGPTTTSTTTSTTADSSGTGDDTSSTAAGSSTGDCPPLTEGCPCDPESDPECEDGLFCTEDGVCEVAADCEMGEDEPNDDPNEPVVLMELGEDDDPVAAMSELGPTGDVDWFRWGCTEPFFGLTSPDIDLDVPEGVRACVFLDCLSGGNPDFECPEGTTELNAPLDNLPGCCVTGPGAFEIVGPNCPKNSNDSVDAYLRIDDGEDGICTPYSFSYGC